MCIYIHTYTHTWLTDSKAAACMYTCMYAKLVRTSQILCTHIHAYIHAYISQEYSNASELNSTNTAKPPRKLTDTEPLMVGTTQTDQIRSLKKALEHSERYYSIHTYAYIWLLHGWDSERPNSVFEKGFRDTQKGITAYTYI